MAAGLKLMSTNELTRLEVIQKINNKLIKQGKAGKLLGLSTRQIRRLQQAYRKNGTDGLISKRRGTTSNRKHSDGLKKKVLQHVQESYIDFGPTLASEKLLERDNLEINKETLRQWMIEAGIWKGKRKTVAAVHQQRARRPSRGELVQIDGSPHKWFEDRGDSCCLLVFVDDAC